MSPALAAVALLAATVSPAAARAMPEAETVSEVADEKSEARTIEELSRKVAASPDDPGLLLRLTRAYLRGEEFDFAEFYFEMALHSESTPHAGAHLWRSVGDLWSVANFPIHAREAWEEAWRAGDASAELRSQIGRARREASAAPNQCYFRGVVFGISFDCGIGETEIERVEAFLNLALRQEEDLFGFALKSPPPVVIDLDRRVFRALETPDWITGSFDGRIRVPLFSGDSLGPDTVGLFLHEIAHAFIADLSRGRAPGWLQEGLAQYVEGRRVVPEDCRGLLSPAGDALEPLNADLRQRSDREKARRAYLLSLSFLQFLIERRGVSSVICVAAGLGRGEEIETALSREMGASVGELEREWRGEIPGPRRGGPTRSRGRLGPRPLREGEPVRVGRRAS